MEMLSSLPKPQSSFFSSLPLNPQNQFFPFLKPYNFTTFCSQNTTEKPQKNPNNNLQQLRINPDVPNKKKKKRKPRPSFNEQIRDKWSVKPISHTTKLPWQLQEQELGASSEMVEKTPVERDGVAAVSGVQSSNLFAQVIRGRKLEELRFDSGTVGTLHSSSIDVKPSFIDVIQYGKPDESYSRNEIDHDVPEFSGVLGGNLVGIDRGVAGFSGDLGSNLLEIDDDDEEEEEEEDIAIDRDERNRAMLSENEVYSRSSRNGKDMGNSESFVRESSADRLPWMPETDGNKANEERQKRSKTELAERTIPEHELKRLRNVALRMKERTKVGAAGVTQALVYAIHEKWKIDEVVKLKFEGPPALHMKRTHEILESKTGGLVIWRSGSSVVLYRGLTYKLDCVQTYIKEKGVKSDDLPHAIPDSIKYQKNISQEELVEMRELDGLLDGLGPRYLDWSGRPPMPVDADLLPGFIRGYKTPFRRLPHGVQRCLTDSETTNCRRQARVMPPHFALGRNRELQGLAAAVVKLWEKSALAKIAIKRGVLNTRNERMAEELKRLTGGTLLSRNKEFIVLYRGNDFLPPSVTESLRERERLTMLQYEEEEVRRYGSPLLNLKSKNSKVPMVAGTLAETAAATSRWAKQSNSEDIDKMMTELNVARRASLVKYLQNKLALAKGKLRKAERALEKVQKYLEPEELPTDLEIITDEERLVFRKMGLSMKPYLLLGRREVFDGTIENMHLHWKYRELVKIVVKGKRFAQVKHIAINLEAESGGVLVSIDKTTKGYDIIFYRGKNYRRPLRVRPRNLLTRRQALARSIELQRREGLKHHISSLLEQMELAKSELREMRNGKELDDKSFYEKLDDATFSSDDEMEEDEDEEAYLLTYDSGDERGVI